MTALDCSGSASMIAAEGAEGARRETGVSSAAARPASPHPAVPKKTKRSRFTADYRVRVLREVVRCKAPGAIGALLRREGIDSPRTCPRGAARATLVPAGGLALAKRGPKTRAADFRIEQLERENAKLPGRLQWAEAMLAIQ